MRNGVRRTLRGPCDDSGAIYSRGGSFEAAERIRRRNRASLAFRLRGLSRLGRRRALGGKPTTRRLTENPEGLPRGDRLRAGVTRVRGPVLTGNDASSRVIARRPRINGEIIDIAGRRDGAARG